MYGEYFHGDFIWWLMPLVCLIGLIIFIAVVSLIVRGIFGVRKGWSKGSETSLNILKKRYAKGEITRDKFQKLKDDINN